jgi:hypothetical protein
MVSPTRVASCKEHIITNKERISYTLIGVSQLTNNQLALNQIWIGPHLTFSNDVGIPNEKNKYIYYRPQNFNFLKNLNLYLVVYLS